MTKRPRDADSGSPRKSQPPSLASFVDNPRSSENRQLRAALAPMMYGFGDDINPDAASVELMRELVVEYIADLTEDAFNVAKIKGKLDAECFKWLVRQPKDRRKFQRVEQLLKVKEEINEAKDLQKHIKER
uniref:Transcription initiation factor TFIID subunit 13 n=1 Tax=Phaeomonas parva TaxID=124430 RepID=A0A7S1XLM5_9STRA|mmetsp:Transcript_19497/g.58969  ORF Transcript_19497/g.58969 Transcript_19497/m.58969 type:complete len:131 (+) Transcript_19497:115-507(+)